MTLPVSELETLIRRDCHDGQSPLFLHPKEVGRDYTDDEMQSLMQRDFHTRLFLSASNIDGKTVAMRTHFTDNHRFTSHLNIIRDFLKAAHATNNFTAAKTNLTELLSMCLQCTPKTNESISKYYTFAMTMASVLSNCAEKTSFEIHPAMVKSQKDSDIARRKLCLLMDIIFSKIAIYRFLVDEEGSNTFRLAFCRSKYNSDKKPLMFAIFSFLMQLCLTSYVVAESISSGLTSWNMKMLPLGLLTLVYSVMLVYPSIRDKDQADEFYGKNWSCLTFFIRFMDSFVNQFLCVVLVFAGFVVIMIQESYIEAVLNSAALLFIPEIDDQLPGLMGFDEAAIIGNYIITTSLKQFDKVCRMSDEEITNEYLSEMNPSIGVDFSDYFLTNIPERASRPEHGDILQPYQVKEGLDGLGHQIELSNFVTDNCLIRKIEWSYTVYNPNTSKPRIGYLKIETMTNAIIEINGKGIDENIVNSDVRHRLEGAFIITQFQMSNHIIKLRVCGSKDAQSFMDAFDYYSLWPISSSGMKLLNKEKIRERRMDMNELRIKKAGIKETIDEKIMRECQYVSMGDHDV